MRTVVIYEDDYDGNELDASEKLDVLLVLSVEGEVAAWPLCLSQESLAAWRKANERFTRGDTTPVRLTLAPPTGAHPVRPPGGDPRTPKIRAWWERLSTADRRELGITKEAPASGKGVIPADVVAVYERATGDTL
jgi:hypothetical protein